MKRIAISLFLLATVLCAAAQKPKTELPVPDLPIDERTNLVTYQDVVKQEGTPQVLYARAMEWVKKYYKNTNEVIKNADAEKCVIERTSSITTSSWNAATTAIVIPSPTSMSELLRPLPSRTGSRPTVLTGHPLNTSG